ncbi:hypothetical protein [uncultured Amaricoccus sp.]|uniref:hypothetical protein n=1 Tax=uncultured Amaricoccus sp. TaxID=339341 RepID=UPI00261FF61D|nr:hypothetical protein [uncultured Amaricoccus sp.]
MGMYGDPPKTDTSSTDFYKKEAERTRREEQARQRRIADGMSEIKTIFEGGKTKMDRATGKYDPKAEYYYRGKKWTPEAQTTKTITETNGFGWGMPGHKDYIGGEDDGQTPGGGTTTREVTTGKTAQEQYDALRGKLRLGGTGGETHEGTAPLLDARRKAQEDFYLPQLDEEFGKTKDELAFALARAGLSTSTAANTKATDLRKGFRLERAGINADIDRDIAGATSQMNDLRTSIEAGLRASGDTTTAANAALAARTNFAADMPELNPLDHVLGGFAEGIGAAQNGYQVGQIRQTARGGAGFKNQSKIVS